MISICSIFTLRAAYMAAFKEVAIWCHQVSAVAQNLDLLRVLIFFTLTSQLAKERC